MNRTQASRVVTAASSQVWAAHVPARCPPVAWPLCRAGEEGSCTPATRCAGMTRRVGTPSAWGSRRPDVGAWQGPRGPEASLCAGPTSGTWHSGRAGGSEAETKQRTPWQCPPVQDKCPRLSGKDGHKELLLAQGALPGPPPPLPGPGHVPRPGRRHSRRGCPLHGHRAAYSPLLPSPLLPAQGQPCARCCAPLYLGDWGYAVPSSALLPPCGRLRPASSCHVWAAKAASQGAAQPCSLRCRAEAPAEHQHNPSTSPQRRSQLAWLCSHHRRPFPILRQPSPVPGGAPGQGWGLVLAVPAACTGCVGRTVTIDPHTPSLPSPLACPGAQPGTPSPRGASRLSACLAPCGAERPCQCARFSPASVSPLGRSSRGASPSVTPLPTLSPPDVWALHAGLGHLCQGRGSPAAAAAGARGGGHPPAPSPL